MYVAAVEKKGSESVRMESWFGCWSSARAVCASMLSFAASFSCTSSRQCVVNSLDDRVYIVDPPPH